MKKRKKKIEVTDFDKFRFEGLKPFTVSNKFYTMNRISEDKTKLVVRVSDSHIFPTQYGYGLILNYNHIVFLKRWQVNMNYYGNEVLLDKNYFNVKEWGRFSDFAENHNLETWEEWLAIAEEQTKAAQDQLASPLRWEK